MRRITWVLAAAVLCGMAGNAGAQFAPPGGGDTTDAGLSGGGAVSIAPPVISLAPPVAPDSPRTSGRGGQVTQSYTTSALVGFVNDEPVFVDDILRPLAESLKRLAGSARSVAEFEAGAKPLINSELQSRKADMLMLSAAERSLTPDDKERLKIVAAKDRMELMTKYGGAETVAEKALEATGSSVEKELLNQKRQHIVEYYIFKYIAYKIEVTYPMVRAAYERDPKKWHQDAQIELFTITLPVSRWLRATNSDGTLGPVMKDPTPQQVKDAENQALATAKEIVGKVKKGDDFATLAELYNSRDPDAGHGGRSVGVTKGSLVNSKLADYVFSLPANTVGEPQLLRNADFTQSFVVVAKVGTKKEERTVTFAEAQAQIEKSIKEQQFMDLRAEELQKLQKTAAIEALDRNLDLVVDAATARYFK